MKIKKFEEGNVVNIERIEKEFNIKLPNDYKDFLIENNGAVIKDAYFYVDDLKQQIMMGCFFGVDLESGNSIIEINKEFRDDILKNSLLIGDDPGSGFLLLVCDGENDGIWYYDHSYFFEQSTDDLNTYFICETFTGFMEILEKTKYIEI